MISSAINDSSHILNIQSMGQATFIGKDPNLRLETNNFFDASGKFLAYLARLNVLRISD
jgi:hypothetical protein